MDTIYIWETPWGGGGVWGLTSSKVKILKEKINAGEQAKRGISVTIRSLIMNTKKIGAIKKNALVLR